MPSPAPRHPHPASPRHDPYAALRVPNYRWFILSVLTMTLASQVQVLVVAWQIYAITHDPLSLGLIGLAEALPFIGFALYAGHVADRFDRRVISLAALALLLACALVLLAFTFWPATSTRATGAWPYYAVIFLTGIGRSFLQPARNALGADIVPRAVYANAVAWRSSTWQTAAVLGPALGGLLYGFTSARVAYVVVLALTGAAVLTVSWIVYEPRAPRLDAGAAVTTAISDGLRFVWNEPVLLGAMTLDLFSVLLGGAEALLPVFASEILRVGPQGLGVLRAAPAAGAVLMSFALAHGRPLRRAGRALLVAVALFALCIIGFGLSRSVALSVGLLAVSGMADQVSVYVRGTLLQVLTPEHLFGRVSSVNAIFIGSSNELGAFESGLAARFLGPVPAVVLGGAASLAVVGVVAAKIPRLRRLGALADDDVADDTMSARLRRCERAAAPL